MINQKSSQLPTPSPEAKAHSDQLANVIKEQIKANNGLISFAEFMQQALYAPGLGYYSAGNYKFGQQGDFVTAPELSPIFSYCLANQCAEILQALEHPDILEFGAGSGNMAADILTRLKQLDCLPEHYYILEVSADLKQRQQQLIAEQHPDFIEKVIWLNKLPTTFSGVILANEVMDAMPVNLFHWENNALHECYVGLDDAEQFNWQLNTPSQAVQQAFNHLTTTIDYSSWHTPYISELNLLLSGWLKSLAECLDKGVILLIDYGFPRHEYYHPQRNQGTLMCHYQHLAHSNPLTLVGLQDITAHVDFTQVVEQVTANGMELDGFTNQASFLINCGLTDLLEESNAPQLNQNTAIKKLTMPNEMGELFKVIGFSKNYNALLTGFTNNDMCHRL